MEKTNIAINPKQCTQCHSCQLRCSLAYTNSFNPEKARIIIDPPDKILFSEDCVRGCSLCVRYCAYGAISVNKSASRSK